MPMIQVKAPISAQKLIAAAGQLDGTELEAVTDSLLVMRAEQRAPHLSRQETDLLLKINIPSRKRRGGGTPTSIPN